MYILGINAFHPNSSACLIKDGKLVAAVEEERFRRIKHCAGFPKHAIQYCLKEADIGIQDLDYITLNRDVKANFYKKAIFVLTKRPSFDLIKNRLLNLFKVKTTKDILAKEFSVSKEEIRAKVIGVEHHLAHLASSFFVSPFDEEAALVSVDAFGDFSSCKVAKGKGNRIIPLYEVNYPDSLGIFYTSFTQFLGFNQFGDEYKVMGLAAFGEPSYLKEMEEILILKPKGRFCLDQKYFSFYKGGGNMSWDNAQPELGALYSDELKKKFGQPREYEEKITKRHMDLAASLQAMYEKALFHILEYAYKLVGSKNLCMAGGCALNSSANGKILKRTSFEKIYIQPASSDAGGGLGAALYLYHQILGDKRQFEMKHVFWGPGFNEKEMTEAIKDERLRGLEKEEIKDQKTLTKTVAKFIADGNVVAWFQGRLEWGPRALGNRCILVDPRREEMRDIINKKVKLREWFRPFAPSILEEYMGEYFEIDYPAPFMMKVYPVKKEKQKEVPAITHKNGTGRPQTVSRKTSPLYWSLINEFRKITGVPLILNTSFNENEPIVCTPQNAVDCFLRTKIDILVMGSYIVKR